MPKSTLLLVEDNPDDLLLIKRAIEKAKVNCNLKIVRDGQEAIDYLQADEMLPQPGEAPRPSLILLDLGLPRVSGFEVLAWVRQQEKFRTLPIVVLTNSTLETEAGRAYALGANAVIQKPSKSEDLVKVASQMQTVWLDMR